MFRAVYLLCLVLSSPLAFAQLTSSHLPIIRINTNGQQIDDEPKVSVRLGIIDNGTTNNINDPWNGYDGYCGIEFRGNSTLDLEKKSYSLELWNGQGEDTAATLLGMGEEEDWILYASGFDPSFANDILAFDIWRGMGNWATERRICELVIDGDYKGLYFLGEKIKRDKNRLDIAKLKDSDISGAELTGGYIIEMDWYDPDVENNNLGWYSKHQSMDKKYNIFFQYYYPKPDKIQPAQATYIQSYIDSFETALFAPNYRLPNGQRYDEFIDINSLVDLFIINELSRSVDAYKLSSFLYKEKNGKLHAGPIWDFDRAFAEMGYCGGENPEGWLYLQEADGCDDLLYMPLWWSRLEEDSRFLHLLRCRWVELRSGLLSLTSLNQKLDSISAWAGDAVVRNFQRWPEEGENGLEMHNGRIEARKQWLSARTRWLDGYIAGECANDTFKWDTHLKIKLYPNPNQGSLNLEINQQGTYNVRIVNTLGQLMEQFTISQTATTKDISWLGQGIYFVEVTRGFVEHEEEGEENENQKKEWRIYKVVKE